jgi:hypothetical protein
LFFNILTGINPPEQRKAHNIVNLILAYYIISSITKKTLSKVFVFPRKGISKAKLTEYNDHKERILKSWTIMQDYVNTKKPQEHFPDLWKVIDHKYSSQIESLSK